MPSETPPNDTRRHWWASLDGGARYHGFPLLTVLFAALTAYGTALFVLPFDLDNIVALSEGDRSQPFGFFRHAITWAYSDTGGSVPIYRPIGYVTIWAQEQAGGLGAEQYFAFNLALWLGCALALYALVHRLTRSRLAAAAAAAVLAVDSRALNELIWIAERQATLALLFGLLAVVAVVWWGDSPRRGLLAATVLVLLSLSALSKEYGIAFFVAVPLLAGLYRPRHWRAVTLAAVGAVAVYVVFRFGLAGGATGAYCEDMGLWKRRHRVCYDALGLGDKLEQYFYNVGATLVGTVFPQFFNDIGIVRKPPAKELLEPLVVAGLAAVGAFRRPRAVLPLLSLVAGNAVLSFLVYRPRNQIIGMAGLYASAGVGLAVAAAFAAGRLQRREWRVAVPLAAAVLAFGWIGWHATHSTGREVESYRSYVEGLNPCRYLRDFPKNVHANIVFEIKRKYLLQDPNCTKTSPR